MKFKTLTTALMLTIGFSACNDAKQAETTTKETETVTNEKTKPMNNLISIIEIPVEDFSRATKFYQSIMGVTIEAMEMDGVQLGVIPNDEGSVNLVLAKGSDYKPTTSGAVLYLNAGEDLQPMLDKVKQNGGEIIVPKTLISPEMGYFALFIDSEGNKLGMHSIK